MKSPAAIVIPDRDVPGKRAMAWAQPIKKICEKLNSFNSGFFTAEDAEIACSIEGGENDWCTWVPSYEFTIDDSSKDFSFVGVRLGDVTGNWAAAPSSSRKSDEMLLSDNPIIDAEPADIIQLPIYLPDNIEIEGSAYSDQDILNFISNLNSKELISQASLVSMNVPTSDQEQSSANKKGFVILCKLKEIL